MQTVAGIDLGTQHLKVVFYDFDAQRVVAAESSPLALHRNKTGVAEQQASWWTDALYCAFANVDRAIVRSAIAMGVSGQQHGFVPVDASGNVLSAVKLWCDTSTEPECQEIMQAVGGAQACLELSGNRILPGYTASKILHFAKRLIDETCLPMSHIADAAGYGSIRRFNDAFKNTYQRTPRDLRAFRDRGAAKDRNATLTVRLPYRKPFNWISLLEFFAFRAIPGVEMIEGKTYKRTISIGGEHGLMTVCPAGKSDYLSLTLDGIATGNLFEVVQRAREIFDLDAPVDSIAKELKKDSALAAMLKKQRGIRVPGAWDGFELAVRAILGQQISVAAATTLSGRIARRYGEPLASGLNSGEADLRYIFPTAGQLTRARFNDIGLVRSRAATIRSLATAVKRGDIDFDFSQDPDDFCDKLKSIKGIGDWTAQYVAMRVLKNPDAFPTSDLGLLKAIDAPNRVSTTTLSLRAENWRPWRAYAALLLWGSLSGSGG